MKLGEQLVADNLLTSDQLDQALRAQVMWGGRLGTNLVELGFLDLDSLSRALGRLHKLPAALARHFERGDRELQRLLSVDFAERFACIPLMRVGEHSEVVIAVADPLARKPNAIIAGELEVEPDDIIQSVAAELRIRYFLERVYGIARTSRFLRTRGPSVPSSPQFAFPVRASDSSPDVAAPIAVVDEGVLTTPVSILTPTVFSMPSVEDPAPPVPQRPWRAPTAKPVEPAPPGDDGGDDDDDLVVEHDIAPDIPPEPTAARSMPGAETLDDLSDFVVTDDEPAPAPQPVRDEPSGPDRRQYVRTLADVAETGPITSAEQKTLGRIALRRVAVVADPNAASTFPEATRAIRRATHRERIGELAMEAIDRHAPACHAAMLLVVRGEAAIGWKGFVRDSPPPPEFAVPLDRPGLVVVARKGITARCSAGELGQIDLLLLDALGHDSGDLVVVPIEVASQVVAMIAIATAPDAPVAAVEAVADAVAAAFARLMHAVAAPGR